MTSESLQALPIYRHRSIGFTLLEIMIALLVFAIIITLTAASMQHTLKTQEILTQHIQELNTWQLAITYLEKDLQNLVDRPFRTEDGQMHAALVGNAHILAFTRGGINNPYAQEKRSTLQRVQYMCQHGTLTRRAWIVLNPVKPHQYHDHLLLSHLQTCEFRYVMPGLKMYAQASSLPFPVAIQITLNQQSWKKISLLISLAGGMHVAKS